MRNKNDQHEMESLAGKTFPPSQNTVCPEWEELRRDLVITDIKDIVKFFRMLLEEREKMNKEVSDNRKHFSSSFL
jgi:hypothetical protein